MKLRLILENVFLYKKLGNFKWSFIDSTDTEIICELTKHKEDFELETYFLINNEPKYNGPKPEYKHIGVRGNTIEKIFKNEIIPLLHYKIDNIVIYPIDKKRNEFFSKMIEKYKNFNDYPHIVPQLRNLLKINYLGFDSEKYRIIRRKTVKPQ